MKNCFANALLVKDGLFHLLADCQTEHALYLERCQTSGRFSRSIDKKYIDRENRLSDLINLQGKACMYIERLLQNLDTDISNIVYEDIDNLPDYDYTADK